MCNISFLCFTFSFTTISFSLMCSDFSCYIISTKTWNKRNLVQDKFKGNRIKKPVKGKRFQIQEQQNYGIEPYYIVSNYLLVKGGDLVDLNSAFQLALHKPVHRFGFSCLFHVTYWSSLSIFQSLPPSDNRMQSVRGCVDRHKTWSNDRSSFGLIYSKDLSPRPSTLRLPQVTNRIILLFYH